MKKLFAVVMVLCLMMSAALAEAPALNWSDFEAAIEAGGVTGQFYTFDEISMKIWIPEGLNEVELTDEDKEAGFIGYFAADDQSAAVSIVYVDMEGTSIEEYAESLGGVEGVTEIEIGTVNDLPCVSYNMPEQDSVSIAFATEAGYILEVTCAPTSEENAELVWGAVVASIQSV